MAIDFSFEPEIEEVRLKIREFMQNTVAPRMAQAEAAGGGRDEGYAITIDGSGNILVTGISVNGSAGSDMAIWRYTDAGTLDTSFDGDGIVVHGIAAGGGGSDTGYAITHKIPGWPEQ